MALGSYQYGRQRLARGKGLAPPGQWISDSQPEFLFIEVVQESAGMKYGAV
jgi:hypothetical protein